MLGGMKRFLVVAGNMTGDMFGVLAGLLLDPELSVLILEEVEFATDSALATDQVPVHPIVLPEEPPVLPQQLPASTTVSADAMGKAKEPRKQRDPREVFAQKVERYREAFPTVMSYISAKDPNGRCKAKEMVALFSSSSVKRGRILLLPVKSLNAAYPLVSQGDEVAIQYVTLNAYKLKETGERDDKKSRAQKAMGLLKDSPPTGLMSGVSGGTSATTSVVSEPLSKEHFTEVSEGTKIVQKAKRSQIVGAMRESWGMKGLSLIEFDKFAEKIIQKCVDTRDHELLRKKRYAVLWVRFSGKKGGPHPQHDTSYRGLKQLITLCQKVGLGVILCGDRAWLDSKKIKLEKLATESKSSTFIDLTEMWERFEWKSSLMTLSVEERLKPIKSRIAQIALLDYLNRRTLGLVHLGFRSGNLEAYSLIGHRVYYMEEKGNKEAKRMVMWRSNPQKAPPREFLAPRYDRIVIDLPASRTGKFIVTQLRQPSKTAEGPLRDNMVAPWGPKRLDPNKILLKQRDPADDSLESFDLYSEQYDLTVARYYLKKEALHQTGLTEHAGFLESDLKKIEVVMAQAANDSDMTVIEGVTHWQKQVKGTE
ncbi:hypothetical protein [Hyalangium gracile]|uniref:hypothetical protein n=1 Tax=Hyalangium gracile TaxID=394092 RepID=UPI001CCCD027|nr:hypothetical protein [Hyalangium gracile]